VRKNICPLPALAGAIFAALFLLCGTPAQAQQTLQALHNHIRPVIANGQAAPVGVLPPSQRMNLAIMLPCAIKPRLAAYWIASTTPPVPTIISSSAWAVY